MGSIIEKKKNLRREYLQKRREINESERRSAEVTICKHLTDLIEKEYGNTMIAAYITDGTEVNLNPFIENCLNDGNRVCVPRFNSNSTTGEYEMVEITDLEKDLKLGKYNIMEPVDTCPALAETMYDNLVWLIPGVVFDERCGRLGRGKGVYDQMISSCKGINIGVFYECQKTQEVPMASHDRSLDMIVTEKGTYRA